MSKSSGQNGRLVRPAGGLSRNELAALGPPLDSPEWAAETALASMIRQPERPLLPIIIEEFNGRGNEFQMDALQIARGLMEELIDTLKTGAASAPMIVDRYSFAWRLLRQADVALRSVKKSELPERGTLGAAAVAFGSLLSIPPNEPLVVALSDMLRLGKNAEYLTQYCLVRKTKAARPGGLPPPFLNAVDRADQEAVATVTWWLIRSRKEEYVEVERDEVRIKFSFLVEETLRDLRNWYGSQIDAQSWIPGLVEDEINKWMTYSGLQSSPSGKPREELAKDLAKAFLKHNDLTTKLRTLEGPGRRVDDRTAALEVQLRQYAEENRTLEQTIEQLRSAGAHQVPEPDAVLKADTGTRDLLRAIDSKYSFDALEAILLGEDSHLTLRSFAMHLFYCARKQGLTNYPTSDRLDLTYADSGLYECEGFDVPPDKVVRVIVTRRGWALKTGRILLPIRRARVSRADAPLP